MEAFGEGSQSSTYYDVLGLTSALLNSQDDSSALVKQAYRRALLRHHPDKSVPSSNSASTTHPPPPIYTIDQISQAFTTLSSDRLRSDYDKKLRLSRSASSSNTHDPQARFQTGIENVDLDDLAFDEQEERWYRSCRCGNERGYSFQQADLEEVEHEGVLMVGCFDCSLWLKVHFAVVDSQDDDDITAAEANKST